MGTEAIVLAVRAANTQMECVEVVTGSSQRVWSANIAAALQVTHCEWSKLCVETFGHDQIVAGEIAATAWVATQDGRCVIAEFAGEGEQTGESVYYERSNGTHGWVDSISRKIVQVG